MHQGGPQRSTASFRRSGQPLKRGGLGYTAQIHLIVLCICLSALWPVVTNLGDWLGAEIAWSTWLGWTVVGAIWAVAVGLIAGTLWQEYAARREAAQPREAEDEDDEDDDHRGMRGRYLIH